MGTPGLSPHLALRIGLAARALPDTGLQRLMNALVDALGLPLTEEKVEHLSLGKLRVAANRLLADTPSAALRQALGYLKGHMPVTIIDDTRPLLECYEEGDMPNSVRLAVASDFGECVDGNFSTCAAFLIYQVSAVEIRLIDRRPAPAINRKSGRYALRTALLDDCHLLYAKALSTPVSARLMAAGIHPVSLREGGMAREKLAELQKILSGHPAPWLARAMDQTIALPPRPDKWRPELIYSQKSSTTAGS